MKTKMTNSSMAMPSHVTGLRKCLRDVFQVMGTNRVLQIQMCQA